MPVAQGACPCCGGPPVSSRVVGWPGAENARYAACARAMGVAPEGEGDQGAVERLLAELVSLNDDLDVPGPEEYGLDAARWEALIPTMAEQALASGSPGNNPLVPNAEEIAALYRQVWAA